MKKSEKDRFKAGINRLVDWMKEHRFPPRLLLIVMGILSTVWFLVRVIPKPSRAAYPCMQVAAPIMSGFIVYLLSLGGITLAFRKAKQNIFRGRYLAIRTVSAYSPLQDWYLLLHMAARILWQ